MSDACLNPGSRLLVGKDSVLLVVVLIQSRDHLVSTKSCSCLVLDVCLSFDWGGLEQSCCHFGIK